MPLKNNIITNSIFNNFIALNTVFQDPLNRQSRLRIEIFKDPNLTSEALEKIIINPTCSNIILSLIAINHSIIVTPQILEKIIEHPQCNIDTLHLIVLNNNLNLAVINRLLSHKETDELILEKAHDFLKNFLHQDHNFTIKKQLLNKILTHHQCNCELLFKMRNEILNLEDLETLEKIIKKLIEKPQYGYTNHILSLILNNNYLIFYEQAIRQRILENILEKLLNEDFPCFIEIINIVVKLWNGKPNIFKKLLAQIHKVPLYIRNHLLKNMILNEKISIWTIEQINDFTMFDCALLKIITANENLSEALLKKTLTSLNSDNIGGTLAAIAKSNQQAQVLQKVLKAAIARCNNQTIYPYILLNLVKNKNTTLQILQGILELCGELHQTYLYMHYNQPRIINKMDIVFNIIIKIKKNHLYIQGNSKALIIQQASILCDDLIDKLNVLLYSDPAPNLIYAIIEKYTLQELVGFYNFEKLMQIQIERYNAVLEKTMYFLQISLFQNTINIFLPIELIELIRDFLIKIDDQVMCTLNQEVTNPILFNQRYKVIPINNLISKIKNVAVNVIKNRPKIVHKLTSL